LRSDRPLFPSPLFVDDPSPNSKPLFSAPPSFSLLPGPPSFLRAETFPSEFSSLVIPAFSFCAYLIRISSPNARSFPLPSLQRDPSPIWFPFSLTVGRPTIFLPSPLSIDSSRFFWYSNARYRVPVSLKSRLPEIFHGPRFFRPCTSPFFYHQRFY